MTAYLEKLSLLLLPRSSSAFSMAASTERPPFTKLHTQLKDYHSIQYTTRSKVDARRDNAAGCVARGVNKPKRKLALHQRVLSVE
ncbi:hypothetical protein Pcac1_g488 [Phytophthora cactorum]|nr:hypothetical protein Pcac1_g488 [Phytophthora cactorum]KAG3198881.1 hypothetical protein PC128_g5669 [Phytophthora cactorum]KAG4063698.1 hypothetical protein PC123_g1485 [Phytophthora cactorum]